MIRNIIFDLGGVLIDIDFERVARSFTDLGIEDFKQQFSQPSISEFFANLEKGFISNEDFYSGIKEQLPGNVSSEEIKTAWNSILGDFRTESMAFLSANRAKYRMFLLSNTNHIHVENVNERLLEQTGVTLLDEYFDKVYYSQMLGMRKPDPEIYRHVLNDADLVASETLFIDDLAANLEPAAAMDIQTHLLLPGQRIEALGL